jgi:hypothetical protein
LQAATALRRADAAVFLNRAEGGTNLVAMEAMAMEVSAVVLVAMEVRSHCTMTHYDAL